MTIKGVGRDETSIKLCHFDFSAKLTFLVLVNSINIVPTIHTEKTKFIYKNLVLTESNFNTFLTTDVLLRDEIFYNLLCARIKLEQNLILQKAVLGVI